MKELQPGDYLGELKITVTAGEGSNDNINIHCEKLTCDRLFNCIFVIKSLLIERYGVKKEDLDATLIKAINTVNEMQEEIEKVNVEDNAQEKSSNV